jgi:WD40 repeat protein
MLEMATLWDLNTGRQVASLEKSMYAHLGLGMTGARFNPDGKLLAVATPDTAFKSTRRVIIQIWDIIPGFP